MNTIEEDFLEQYLLRTKHPIEETLPSILGDNFKYTNEIGEVFKGLKKDLIQVIRENYYLLSPQNVQFYLSFFSVKRRLVYLTESRPRVCVDADLLKQEFVKFLRVSKREDRQYLEDILHRTLSDLLTSPIRIDRVRFFNYHLDDRFVLKFTRELKAQIEGFLIIKSFEDIRRFTYGFDYFF